MKLHIPKEDLKNCGILTPIPYKHNTNISKTTTDKLNFLKVDIKTQPGDRDSKTITIYVPLFCTGSPQALLKLATLLNKITQGQDLSTGPQKFKITRNLVIGEAIQVFEKNSRDRGT